MPVNSPTTDDLMQHADSLYRFAFSRVKNHHAAEDLVQDVLLAALQKVSTFDGRSSLSTWLMGIMKFKVIDHFRRSNRTPTDRAADAGEEGDALESMFNAHGSWKVDPNYGIEFLMGGPDEKAWHQEILKKVQLCLSKLPDRLRLLFVLREVDGLDVPSAASAAGVTPGSAAVLLTRSRQRLRGCLQEMDIKP